MNNKKRIIKCLEDNGIIILENGDFENLNSINFISAIISLEQEFEIEFPDEYLLMSTMCDLENLELVIQDIIDGKSDEM